MIVNSVLPAANVFLTILFNLPPAIFNLMSLCFVLVVVLSVLCILSWSK